MIDAIQGITSGLPALSQIERQGNTDFTSVFESQITSLSDKLQEADRAVQLLSVGGADNLHHTMMALTEAKASFDLAVQVRNRVVDGVQELLRMSI